MSPVERAQRAVDSPVEGEAYLDVLRIPVPMSETRALQINAAICNRAFHAMGLPQEPIGDLAGVSLAEMLIAVEMVGRINASGSHRQDGKQVIHVIPDQRLVASVYALENYERRTAIASKPVTIEGGERIRAIHVIQTQPMRAA